MRVVGRQGTSLTESDRRRLQQRQQVKTAFMPPHLQQMLDDAARDVAKLEEQGTTWENPNKFRHDRTEKGTPFVGDVAGY